MEEYITLKEARERFGISAYQLSQMVSNGQIKVYDNPKDRRSFLVAVAELERILKMPKVATPRRKKQA